MEILLGYIASVLIGISLGLIGGGGSILTMPVLVYLFHVEPSLATAYSLFIVGITAAVGGVRGALRDTVDFRVAALFALPGFASVYLTRRYIVPLIPHELIRIGEFTLTRDTVIMVFFALVMFAAAVAMIRSSPGRKTEHRGPVPYLKILLEGAVVGMLTGVVGAGGGFLIIPALVLFANLPMEKAIGTSLVIIAVKSLVGFLGDIGSGQLINFGFLGIISLIAVAGILIGMWMSDRIDGRKLKGAFGWFVMIAGAGVIILEIIR